MKTDKIVLEKISPRGLSRLGRFLEKAEFKDGHEFTDAPPGALAALFRDQVRSARDSGLKMLLAKSGSEPVALLSWQPLKWDSAHFGLPMAGIRHVLGGVNQELDFAAKKLLIQTALRRLKDQGFQHLSARLSADDFNAILALEKNGFYLADTMVIYAYDYRKRRTPPRVKPGCELRFYRPSDFQLVKDSVAPIFQGYPGRFHRDPNLDRDRSDRLYFQWLLNSCKGMADRVILALVRGRLAGIATLETRGELSRRLGFGVGEIPLVGVAPEFRGRGVYTGMVNFAQNHFKNRIAVLRYSTQLNNLFVQRALTNLGFQVTCALQTFHHFVNGR